MNYLDGVFNIQKCNYIYLRAYLVELYPKFKTKVWNS